MVKAMFVILLVFNVGRMCAHGQEIDMAKEKHLYDYLAQEGKKIGFDFHDLKGMRDFLSVDIDTPDEEWGVAVGVLQLKIEFVFKTHLLPTEENLIAALSKPEEPVREVWKLRYESPRHEALDLLASVPVENLERRLKALEECYVTTHDADIKKKTVLEMRRADKNLFTQYARYFLRDGNVWLEGKIAFLSAMTGMDKACELPGDVLDIIKRAVRGGYMDRPFDDSLVSLIAAYASKEKIADVDGFIAKSFFDEESQRRKIAELQRRVNDKLAMEKSRQRLEENKSFGEQIIESQRTK